MAEPLVLAVTCDAPRKRIWQALGDSTQRSLWWSPEVSFELRQGAAFSEAWSDDQRQQRLATGSVMQVDEGSFLTLQLQESAWLLGESSHVYLSLDGDQKSTRVEVRHESAAGFTPERWGDVRAQCLQKWTDWLANLQRHMHKGEHLSDNDIRCETILPMPPDEAFSLWIHREELLAWLCEHARVEARSGGPYELFWDVDRPDTNSTLGCQVIHSIAGQHLWVQWRGPEHHPIMDIPGSTLVFVSLQKRGHETAIRLVHTGFGRSPEWMEARDWQAMSWRRSFEQLETVYGE